MAGKENERRERDAGKPSKPGRIARGQELEVQHLAETTGISPGQARMLLQRHGNDWAKIREEVENIKAEL